MKSKYITLFIASLFCTFSHAKPSTPPVCPAADALKMIQFTDAAKDGDKGWEVFATHNYNSNEQWTVSMANLKAKDADEAIRMGNAMISTVHFISGPSIYGGCATPPITWACEYQVHSGNPVTAITTSK